MERKTACPEILMFLWIVITMQIATITDAYEFTTTQGNTEDVVPVHFVWSSWGTWSSCSKSCGGGVSVQMRMCLPRSPSNMTDSSILSTTSSPITIVKQIAKSHQCTGPARRYHECNTQACQGGPSDSRADQCAAYNRRPYRGRFYTWVPYVDGDSPCTLNCRPLGQAFYASLGLVTDGTPCTKPGFRALCIQGDCKALGRDSVLASASTREVRCGRRLVSGLFARPRLPLGYSHVATVPRGACRLNVSEIVPSDNYIALKVSNGSYIMNGEFAISTPGTYDAVGARFYYKRVADLDSVYAHGPFQHPIDIMILYTQPNPSIKYEYFTESLPGEINQESSSKKDYSPELPSPVPTKHTRRHDSFRPHHRIPYRGDSFPNYPDYATSKEGTSSEEDIEDNIVGQRRFSWKITSFNQCSRTCGGGIQIGKHRCVESSASGKDREVSPVHCNGSPPSSRRRRCGMTPCAPRWRTAAWSTCPACGPAERVRVVGCVQDHSKGITKVNDQKCPAPKPATTEDCNIPDCDSSLEVVNQVYLKRTRSREQIDSFRDGPVYTVVANKSDIDVGPEYTFSAAGGWLYTDWSECVGWCVGGGVQTRGVQCADPAGCAPRIAPESQRGCTPEMTCDAHEGQWFTGDWSSCSTTCKGKQVRGVLCIGGSGRHLKDSACKGPRPEHERDCEGQCLPTWYLSDWEQCKGKCEEGVGLQRRTVWCSRGQTSASSDKDCASPKPAAQGSCILDRCITSGRTMHHDASATIAPELVIESQRVARNEETTTTWQELTTTTKESELKDCVDKLFNCALAVQARLCHYNYYVQNCCNSCQGR